MSLSPIPSTHSLPQFGSACGTFFFFFGRLQCSSTKVDRTRSGGRERHRERVPSWFLHPDRLANHSRIVHKKVERREKGERERGTWGCIHTIDVLILAVVTYRENKNGQVVRVQSIFSNTQLVYATSGFSRKRFTGWDFLLDEKVEFGHWRLMGHIIRCHFSTLRGWDGRRRRKKKRVNDAVHVARKISTRSLLSCYPCPLCPECPFSFAVELIFSLFLPLTRRRTKRKKNSKGKIDCWKCLQNGGRGERMTPMEMWN